MGLEIGSGSPQVSGYAAENFFIEITRLKAVFLLGKTPKSTQQKCMPNEVLWEEEL